MGGYTFVKAVILLTLCWGEITCSISLEKVVHGMKAGDWVVVSSDRERVMELQRGHGGWSTGMQETLGKIGKIEYFDGDNDARVLLCRTYWYYNPEVLTKLASSEDSFTGIYVDDCVSGPELSVTKKRVKKIGRSVDFDCSVRNNRFNSSYVRWVKEGKVISRDTTLEITDPRIAVVSDTSNTYTLQIDDIQLDDAGTYACQVRTRNDSLLITATVELVVQSPPSIYENSTRFLIATEGEGARLECYADGEPEPDVTWHRVFKESILPLEDLIYRGDVLDIATVLEADGGTYYCVAENGAGRSARRDVQLVVLKPGEVYTGRPLIEERTAPVATADTASPVLVEHLQLYADRITNSTGAIRLQVEDFNTRLEALGKGLFSPEACNATVAQTK